MLDSHGPYNRAMLDSSDELITTPAVTESSSFLVIPQTHQSATVSAPVVSSKGSSYLTSSSTPKETATASKFDTLSIHSTSSPLPSLPSHSTTPQSQQRARNYPNSAHFASLERPSSKSKHDLHRKSVVRPTMIVTPVPNSNHSSGNRLPKTTVEEGCNYHVPNGISHSVGSGRDFASKQSNVSSASSSPPFSIPTSIVHPHKGTGAHVCDKPFTNGSLNSSLRLVSTTRFGPVSRLSKLLRLSLPNRLIFAWFVLIFFICVFFVIRHFSTFPSAGIHASVSRFVVVGVYHVWFTVRRHARRLLHDYQRLLHIYPLASRAISAGIIFFFADLIAQFLNRTKQRPFSSTYSFGRNMRYSFYGLLLMGPLLYVWYGLMHCYGPPDTIRGSIQKALIENFTLEPGCIIIYVVYDAIVYQRPFSYVKRTIRTRLFPVWVNQCMFWFPANFSNYYIGTPDMRVIFSNLCSLLWNIYFSAKASRWSSSQESGHAPPPSHIKPVPV